MSRFQLLSDALWTLIEDLLPVRTGKKGRSFRDARQMVEGIIYRYRCGIAWRDVPEVFGPWQTISTWYRRMSAEDTWDAVLARLLAAADEAGIIDWAVAVDSTIARAHQIRYYESIGLLPQPQRTATGYREYGSADADRPIFVKTAQRLGMSLDDIREIFAFRDRGEPPCAYVRAVLDEQVADIDQRIAGAGPAA